MTFEQLIELIDDHYPDTLMFNVKVGGDTLAKFVYNELEETFEPDDAPEKQIATAIAKLGTAIKELQDLQTHLIEVRTKRKLLPKEPSSNRARR